MSMTLEKFTTYEQFKCDVYKAIDKIMKEKYNV